MANGESGGAALILVSVLISELQARGLVSAPHLADMLRRAGDLPDFAGDRGDLADAIALLEGMTGRIARG